MVAFIDAHRVPFGVEPICTELPIAPSTYYAHKACQATPELRSKRAQRDEWLASEITRVRAENFDAYGAYKVWRQLNRDAVVVARCTVERLMRKLGLQGVVRGRAFITTTQADTTGRSPDLLSQDGIPSCALWQAARIGLTSPLLVVG